MRKRVTVTCPFVWGVSGLFYRPPLYCELELRNEGERDVIEAHTSAVVGCILMRDGSVAELHAVPFLLERILWIDHRYEHVAKHFTRFWL